MTTAGSGLLLAVLLTLLPDSDEDDGRACVATGFGLGGAADTPVVVVASAAAAAAVVVTFS